MKDDIIVKKSRGREEEKGPSNLDLDKIISIDKDHILREEESIVMTIKDNDTSYLHLINYLFDKKINKLVII